MAAGQSAENRRNNIGLIRLVLATSVIVSHSYKVCCGRGAVDPLMAIDGGQASIGSLAVDLFFLMSGYLLTKSWLTSNSASSYLRKRILRIYPGFTAAVCLSVIVAALCTSSGPINYFRSLYYQNDELLRTALLLQNPNDVLDLADTFASNPYPGAVNHSLWTLQPELFCYLLLAGVGVIVDLKKGRVALAIAVAALAGFALNVFRFGDAVATLWRFITFFSWGMVFYSYRHSIPLGKFSLAGISIVALSAGLLYGPWLPVVFPVAAGYLLFSLAFSRFTPLSEHFDDFDLSYGIYVYAWPVQQLVVHSFGIRDPLVLFAICVPIVGVLAWGSWVFIERPFLARRAESAGTQSNASGPPAAPHSSRSWLWRPTAYTPTQQQTADIR